MGYMTPELAGSTKMSFPMKSSLTRPLQISEEFRLRKRRKLLSQQDEENEENSVSTSHHSGSNDSFLSGSEEDEDLPEDRAGTLMQEELSAVIIGAGRKSTGAKPSILREGTGATKKNTTVRGRVGDGTSSSKDPIPKEPTVTAGSGRSTRRKK